MDHSVLDEIIAAVEPVDAAASASAVERLPAGLGELHVLAERLTSIRRKDVPPIDRKVLLLLAGGDAATIPLVQTISAGRAAVNALTRAAEARLMIVDTGIPGAEGQDLGPGVIVLRATGPDSDLIALQIGIALVLSLASEGLDLLALATLGEGGPESAAAAGALLAAAAIRVPVVLDPAGPAATRAAKLAPAASGYVIVPPTLGVTLADGSSVALAFRLCDAAVRLLAEVR